MNERISVHDYRAMISGGAIPEKPSPVAALQALGRLEKGERNKTEAAYEAHLEQRKHAGEIAWFCFEGIKLRLADSTSLTIDFPVMRADGGLEMHDVKGGRGIWADDAKVKMKVAAELYPFPFFVCFPRRAKDGGGWDVEQI